MTNPITPPELPSPEQIVLRAGLADIPSFVAPSPPRCLPNVRCACASRPPAMRCASTCC
ncbi:hypothetical protein ACFSTJ_17510 [Ottowia pentelensis]|uniref:hypothetical protein n=1 Tax=Ottowia pentelensis TaxID=511108 RepID=UPI00362F5D07